MTGDASVVGAGMASGAFRRPSVVSVEGGAMAEDGRRGTFVAWIAFAIGGREVDGGWGGVGSAGTVAADVGGGMARSFDVVTEGK